MPTPLSPKPFTSVRHTRPPPSSSPSNAAPPSTTASPSPDHQASPAHQAGVRDVCDHGPSAKALEQVTAPPTRATGNVFQRALRFIGQGLTDFARRLRGDDQDSKPHLGWLARAGHRPGPDVTVSFRAGLTAAAADTPSLPAEARDHTYLLVPGLFTERYPGYFDANQSHLEKRGLTVKRATIDTDASVEGNARALRDQILELAKDGKKVVLIGHSKGGVDAAAALAMFPELKEHVRANIAMQAPFGGSPVAHDISTCPQLSRQVGALVENVLDGSRAALEDLAYTRRQAFCEAHPYPTDVPTVSLATSSRDPLSVTAASALFVRSRYGADSDGLVVRDDAKLPGSLVVELDDMDHSAPAMKGVCAQYDPGHVTEALIGIALRQR